MKAFSRPGGRKAALARMEGPMPPTVDEHGLQSPLGIETFASETGLNLAFVHLAAVLAQDEPNFLQTVIIAIPDNADLLALVRRWIISVDAEVAGLINDRVIRTATRAVVTLHEKALSGVQLFPADWRKARMAFPALDDTISSHAGGVTAAAAWDLDSMPGAASDVAVAWSELGLALAEVEIAWRPEEDELLRAYTEAGYQYVQAEAGLSDDLNDSGWRDRCETAWSRYSTEHPTDLFRSSDVKERHRTVILHHAQTLLLAELALEAKPQHAKAKSRHG
jgi:hypothetical protein